MTSWPLFATVLALALGCGPRSVSGFYLPGTAPRDYQPGEKVPVDVNSLSPMLNTQLRSLISYDYYEPRFHFCQPAEGAKKQPESLGSILWGDRIFNSPFEVKMLENSTCNALCKSVIPPEDAKFINKAIKDEYGINLMVDGLPGAEMRSDSNSGEVFYDAGGFPLGDPSVLDSDGLPVLNNHYDIYLQYHKDRGNHRVVGVLVYPRSTASEKGEAHCFNDVQVRLSEKSTNEVFYSYSVQWIESDIPWALRWDNYLHVFDARVHWFSLINSLIVVVFLVSMVATVLFRSMSKDIHRYNALDVDLSEDIQEDSGWKLVHGEVFRTPQRPMLLSAMVGTGTQLVFMVLVTLVFALFGFLSPANRGTLATVLLITWTLFSSIAGYVSARIYGSMKGDDWKSNLLLTATAAPIFVFGMVFLLNLVLIASSASGAVPFGTMIAVVLLYLLLSIPLCVAGYFLGLKHGIFALPVRVNSIPRQIPPQPTYLKTWPSILLGGVLPFGAAFVEAFFILQSTFAHRAYYAFGFTFLDALITLLTTATMTILFVYFMLDQGEYRWHWRSFFIGGGSSAYFVLYGIWYWASRSSFDGVSSAIIYFGYLFILASANLLLSGSIGFIASFFALRMLYSKIRVD